MARPREFDIDTVLDHAIDAFWANGYEGTSMADLVEAMGLQKGSIYKAFGDKRALFIAALQRYLDRLFIKNKTMLAHDDPITAVDQWMRGIVELAKQDGACLGCLALNSAIECGRDEPDIRELLVSRMHNTMQLLESKIAEGQACGQIRSDIDAMTLAYNLQTQLFGMITLIRGSNGEIDIEPLLRTATKLIR